VANDVARERDASACVRRHHAFALATVMAWRAMCGRPCHDHGSAVHVVPCRIGHDDVQYSKVQAEQHRVVAAHAEIEFKV